MIVVLLLRLVDMYINHARTLTSRCVGSIVEKVDVAPTFTINILLR